MAEGSGSVRNEPLLVERPAGAVWHTIRGACRRLYSVEDGFVGSFSTSLMHLVPELQHTTPDGGHAIGEGLARAVLWAALTNDPPEVVEATFQNLGAEYNRRGFPDSGYHGAGHALLRAARDAQISDWTSELSSGWVAYYSWLAAHLAEGARRARAATSSLPVLPAAPTVPPPPLMTDPGGLTIPPSHSAPQSHHPSSPGHYSRAQDPAASPPTGPLPLGAPSPTAAHPAPVRAAEPAPPRHDPPPPAPREERPGYAHTTGRIATRQVPPHYPAPGPEGDLYDQQQYQNPQEPATFPPQAETGLRFTQPPATLDEILEFLHSNYFPGNERALGAILTRVALRTGADLRAPRPDQRTNPAVIANVLAVLQVMGYVVQSPGAEMMQLAIPTPPRPTKPSRWWNRRRQDRASRRSVPDTFR